MSAPIIDALVGTVADEIAREGVDAKAFLTRLAAELRLRGIGCAVATKASGAWRNQVGPAMKAVLLRAPTMLESDALRHADELIAKGWTVLPESVTLDGREYLLTMGLAL